MAKKPGRSFERIPLDDFFQKFDIKKSEAARQLGVKRQQITTWYNSSIEYLAEYCVDSGEFRVIKPEVIVTKTGRTELFEI